jgi:Arm DNA-binding domain
MELQVLTEVLGFRVSGKYSQIRRQLRVHLWVSVRRDAGIFAALGIDMPLSDTEIRKSKVGPKAYRLSDGGGFYIWIGPAGGKLWRWDYRHNQKQKTMTFGKYPDVSFGDGSR